MGLFHRNWLEEGFYEEDSQGDLTKLTDPKEIKDAAKRGKLYEHDGIGMSLWQQNETNKLPADDDDYGGIMGRHFRGDDNTNSDDDGSIIKHFKD